MHVVDLRALYCLCYCKVRYMKNGDDEISRAGLKCALICSRGENA